MHGAYGSCLTQTNNAAIRRLQHDTPRPRAFFKSQTPQLPGFLRTSSTFQQKLQIHVIVSFINNMAEKHDAPTSSTDMGQAPSKDTNLTGIAPKAIIKNVDMSEEMQQDSVDIASAALEKYNIEKDIAAQIKKEFDRKHGPTWHVVVGKNFGSYVTHGMSFCLHIHLTRLAPII